MCGRALSRLRFNCIALAFPTPTFSPLLLADLGQAAACRSLGICNPLR